jgi:hypothetical protein
MMLSTVLVCGAFLFVRTLSNLSQIDPGFRSDNLLLFAIRQPESRYPAPLDLALHARIEERLRALPGVDGVTLSEVAYLSDEMESANFLPEGEKLDPNREQSAPNNSVGAGFFATMGIPIIAGREFNAHDTATSRKVAVISESLARKAFPARIQWGGISSRTGIRARASRATGLKWLVCAPIRVIGASSRIRWECSTSHICRLEPGLWRYLRDSHATEAR